MSALMKTARPRSALPVEPPQAHGRLATALDGWANASHRAHAQIALLVIAVAATAVLALTWSLPDRTMILRLVGLVLFATHVIANKAIVGLLGWLSRRGMPEAGRALEVYLAPTGLTSLDIGLIWIGLAAIAPLFDLFAPTATIAG